MVPMRLPIKAWVPTAREREFDTSSNETFMATDLDTLEERRQLTALRIVGYQQKVKTHHDSRVRPRYF